MKKTLLFATLALAITACSRVEHWTDYGSDSLNTSHLAENQSLAVFYRVDGNPKHPINVYVNGDYQVSLLEKGYSPITLCSKNQLVTASYSTTGFGNRTDGKRFDLPAQKIAYFRANTTSNKPVFEAVEEEVARKELNALKGKVTHALSRVTHNRNCK